MVLQTLFRQRDGAIPLSTCNSEVGSPILPLSTYKLKRDEVP